MIICASNINKYIVNLWKLTAYLESTFMNYLGFQFSNNFTFSCCDFARLKFVPLVPLLVEVGETHIDTRKLLLTSTKYSRNRFILTISSQQKMI